jgi:hypothetical protein
MARKSAKAPQDQCRKMPTRPTELGCPSCALRSRRRRSRLARQPTAHHKMACQRPDMAGLTRALSTAPRPSSLLRGRDGQSSSSNSVTPVARDQTMRWSDSWPRAADEVLRTFCRACGRPGRTQLLNVLMLQSRKADPVVVQVQRMTANPVQQPARALQPGCRPGVQGGRRGAHPTRLGGRYPVIRRQVSRGQVLTLPVDVRRRAHQSFQVELKLFSCGHHSPIAAAGKRSQVTTRLQSLQCQRRPGIG